MLSGAVNEKGTIVGHKKRGKRGYPVLRIDPTIEVIKIVKECGGKATKKDIGEGLGKSGGNLAGYISASARYGLIVGRGEFKLTPLAESILHPIEEGEDVKSKIEAFLHVEVFKEIYDRFKDHGYPRDSIFQNILIREYGMTRKDAIKVSNIIKDFTQKYLKSDEVFEMETEDGDEKPTDIHKKGKTRKTPEEEIPVMNKDIFEIIRILGYLQNKDVTELSKDDTEEVKDLLNEMAEMSQDYRGFNSTIKFAVNVMETSPKYILSTLENIDHLITILKKDLGIETDTEDEKPTEEAEPENIADDSKEDVKEPSQQEENEERPHDEQVMG